MKNTKNEFECTQSMENIIGDHMKLNSGKMRFVLTNSCNLNCKFCHAEGVKQTDNYILNANDIKKILNIGKYFNINKVTFTGGEISLFKEKLVNIIASVSHIKHIKENSIITNGIFLSSTFTKRLKNAGVNEISISIPSLNHKKYTYVTGKNCLDQVLGGVFNAIDSNLNITINVVLLNSLEKAIITK